MTRAPLLVPALAFAGAVAAETHGLAACAALAVFGTVSYRRARLPAAVALLGLLLAAWRGHPAMLAETSRTARFAGTVVGDVRAGEEGGATFAFALERGIVVRARVRDDRVVAGERLVVRGRLEPFDEPRNPGEPSRRAIAVGEGLAGELIGAAVLARAPPDPRDARSWAARARAALSARLRAVVREPEATVLAGALWGERGTLPSDVREDFQATGTVHVLVTAGLHLGVIGGLVFGVLRLARVPRAARCPATIPCVIAYAWLSGAHLPSQRAAVMLSVVLLARAHGARPVSWNALALAAIVVTALWPASVTTVSFALSFSCLAAIILFANRIAHALERWTMPEKVREALALTIATQIGVWPLSAATFGVVAPYAVLANAVVVPVTGLAMTAGIAALLTSSAPVIGRAAATLATYDVDLILRVVTGVAALPGARVWVAPPPPFAIVAYDGLAVLAAAAFRSRPRTALALLALASAAVLATTLRFPDGKLTITMLDVGQADAIVIRTPRGHVLMVDSGGRLERGPNRGGRSPAELVGERVVLAYLKREGIRHVDLLVNTHPHGDHVGGCAPIVRALRVDAILDSGQQYSGRAFTDCLAAARQRNVPVVTAREGMRRSTDDGVTLDVLAPGPLFLADTGDDVNENSIVLRLTYTREGRAPFRALFMGDAGQAREARLLGESADVSATLLKVGHHGSRYASTREFIAAVRPAIALISVGRHNTFGHPAPSTLATLASAGARFLATDRCGAIRVVADDGTVKPIWTCRTTLPGRP